MPVTELGVDERLARSADRKLRRYGSALDTCLNSVLLTIVRMPGMRAFSVERHGNVTVPHHGNRQLQQSTLKSIVRRLPQDEAGLQFAPRADGLAVCALRQI